MRVSLGQVRKKSGMGLKRLVRSPQTSDSAQAYDLVKAIAIEAPLTTPAMVHDWDHANASYWLWPSEVRKGTLEYNREKLLAAATRRAAEFELTRG